MKASNSLLEELHILSPIRGSICSLLDETLSLLGQDELIRLFQRPLKSREEIIDRQNLCKGLLAHKDFINLVLAYPIDGIYEYLTKRLLTSHLTNLVSELLHYLRIRIKYPTEYKRVKRDSGEFYKMLCWIGIFYEVNKINLSNKHPFEQRMIELAQKITHSVQIELEKRKHWGMFLFQQTFLTIRIDYLLRERYKQDTITFIKMVARLDAYFSLAVMGKKYNFTYPSLHSTASSLTLELEDFFHPLLSKPIKNSLTLCEGQQQLILTGPNTAGKSTLLKSIGICIYLTHIGGAIPAKRGKVPFIDRLEISFSKKDNLLTGASLFSLQLDHLGRIMEAVKNGEHVIALFDELFSGTNFEDMTACLQFTVSELGRFQHIMACLSTHNRSFAQKFLNDNRVLLQKLEMKLNDNEWQPTYRLEEGISNQNIGFRLLKERNIF